MALTMTLEWNAADEALADGLPSDLQESYMIPRVLDELDELASEQDVSPISDFVRGDADLLEEFEDEAEDEAGALAESIAKVRSEQTHWHAASSVLETFKALQTVLADEAVIAKLAKYNRRLDADELLEELDAFVENLDYLQEQQIDVRLAVE